MIVEVTDASIKIQNKVLDKYKNSIPRKAFIEAMAKAREEAVEIILSEGLTYGKQK